MDFPDINAISEMANQALSHQVTQFSIAFTIAAWIHASQVKKEIANRMSNVTEAINNVALALRDDLTKQSKRIETVEGGINKLTSRVETLEKTKGV